MNDNPRKIALDVLARVRRDDAYAAPALDSLLNKSNLSEKDSGLAVELVYGVLRNLTLLDFLLNRAGQGAAKKSEPKVLDALRLGAYQVLFLDRVPAHAAVNETVKLVPRRVTGFVNAVMRKTIGVSIEAELDSIADPLDRIATETSHPRWIVEIFAERFGPEGAAALCRADQRPLPNALRANPLKNSRAQLIEYLGALGVNARPADFADDGVVVDRLDRILKADVYQQGRFMVQGEAAQLVVELLDPQPGERVLDSCAAPGGKTTHIAQKVGPEGSVIACDVSSERLTLVTQNAILLGHENIRTVTADLTRKPPSRIGANFDAVLVDAPCSALGELGKNPDVRYRRTPESVRSLLPIQRLILEKAATLVKPGGTLVYSTCTLTFDENEGAVLPFLARRPDFSIDPADRIFGQGRKAFVTEQGFFLSAPHLTGGSGFFAARLVRAKAG